MKKYIFFTSFLIILLGFLTPFFAYKVQADTYTFTNFVSNLPHATDDGTNIGIQSNCSSDIHTTNLPYWIQVDSFSPINYANANRLGNICYSSTFLYTHSQFIDITNASYPDLDWTIGHTVRIFFSATGNADEFYFQTDVNGGSIEHPIVVGTLIDAPYTPATCTWSDFSTWGGCILNVLHDVFAPSSSSLSQFTSLYTTYASKPPFGYVTSVINTLKNVNDTGTSVFTLQSVTILNTMIFNPLRLAFTWILWLGFAFVLLKRFKDIQL